MKYYNFGIIGVALSVNWDKNGVIRTAVDTAPIEAWLLVYDE